MTAPPAESSSSDGVGAVVRDVEIVNKKGLHARASAKFVQCAEQFDAQITVTRGHETVGGTSIMGLMMLAAGPGTTVTIRPRATRLRPRSRRSPRWLQAASAKKTSPRIAHKEIFIYVL